jgi:hypothetical protein
MNSSTQNYSIPRIRISSSSQSGPKPKSIAVSIGIAVPVNQYLLILYLALPLFLINKYHTYKEQPVNKFNLHYDASPLSRTVP